MTSHGIQRNPIGATGVAVSALGLGTSHLSGARESVTEEQACDTVRTALQEDIQYFDTAPAYGLGEAERRLGTALRDAGDSSCVVSTKVGRTGNETAPMSGDSVRRSVHDSLRRLGRETLDIVLIHDPDDWWTDAVEQVYPCLDRLRADGIVRAIGVGMTSAPMLARFVRETDIDVVLCAGRYGLMDQSAVFELMPEALRRGVSVMIAGVLHNGLLKNPVPGARFNYGAASIEEAHRAQQAVAICRAHGADVTSVGIHLALAHPAVACVISGAGDPSEVRGYVQALTADVPPAVWDELSDTGILHPAAVVPPSPGSPGR